MGLDISVIINLESVDSKELSDDELESGNLYHMCNEAPSLKKRGGNVKEGFYKGEYTSGFRAGSYSGYGEWRRDLCQIMLDTYPKKVWDNSQVYEGKPFVELINFSDCEGYFGTDVCAKLAKDFEENRHKLPQKEGFEWDYFLERYDLWAEALKKAAENKGVVKFS
jgi:hypothetical protein